MTRIDGHLSHRGRALLLLGGVWVLIGISIFLSDDDTLGPWATLAPFQLRAAVWIAAGVFSIASAAFGAGRERTKWAFAALVVPAALRGASSIVALALALWHGSGDSRALVDAIAWTLIVAFVVHEASSPMIPATLKQRRRRDHA